jgi:cell division protein DivIC
MLVALSVQCARTYHLAREAAQLEQHRRDLINANARLREEIWRLETDDRYIERLAREQLGLVRPGEIELLIVPQGSPPPPDAARGGTPAAPEPVGDRPEATQAAWWGGEIGDFLKHLFGWLRF